MGIAHGAVGFFVQLFQAVESLFLTVAAEHFHGHAEAVLIRHDEAAQVEALPTTLDAALDALEADHDYLTEGGVFPEQLIKTFIANKRKECFELSKIPHPAEFDRYFNL